MAVTVVPVVTLLCTFQHKPPVSLVMHEFDSSYLKYMAFNPVDCVWLGECDLCVCKLDLLFV